MSPPRVDPLDVIYEDDETDEGAVSADGDTSLHGHPDHEHADDDVRALAAENALLHENISALVREVACADAEMMRWRSRCRKIEDERDALSRELDRCKAELERRQHARAQSMVVYSTAEGGPQQPPPPLYRSDPETSTSPPPRFASPRMHALPAGAAQPYTRAPPPAIAIEPTREPTPPGAGVPTHRGRLAPPRTSPSPRGGRKQEQHGWAQAEQPQPQERGRRPALWEQPQASSSKHAQREREREREQAQREREQAQQEWEHIQYSREPDQNNPLSPVLYSTGAPEGWSYFDIPRQSDAWTPAHPPAPRPHSFPAAGHEPFLYSSAYPHPNGHGQGRHERDEGPPGRATARPAAPHIQLRAPAHPLVQSHVPPRSPAPPSPSPPEPRRAPPDAAQPPTSTPASSAGSSSAGSHDAAAPAPAAPPHTPPDPLPAPAFVLSPTSPVFRPFQPVVDPEFGPVIVHGPLPPRVPPPPQPRRKREPASVPPRHLSAGKGGGGAAAFGGAAMGMGGGVAMAVGEEWAWGRR